MLGKNWLTLFKGQHLKDFGSHEIRQKPANNLELVKIVPNRADREWTWGPRNGHYDTWNAQGNENFLHIFREVRFQYGQVKAHARARFARNGHLSQEWVATPSLGSRSKSLPADSSIPSEVRPPNWQWSHRKSSKSNAVDPSTPTKLHRRMCVCAVRAQLLKLSLFEAEQLGVCLSWF